MKRQTETDTNTQCSQNEYHRPKRRKIKRRKRLGRKSQLTRMRTIRSGAEDRGSEKRSIATRGGKQGGDEERREKSQVKRGKPDQDSFSGG